MRRVSVPGGGGRHSPTKPATDFLPTETETLCADSVYSPPMEQESHPCQHFADHPIIDRDLVPCYDLPSANTASLLMRLRSLRRLSAQWISVETLRMTKPIEEILAPKPGRRDRTFYRALQSL